MDHPGRGHRHDLTRAPAAGAAGTAGTSRAGTAGRHLTGRAPPAGCLAGVVDGPTFAVSYLAGVVDGPTFAVSQSPSGRVARMKPAM